MLKRKITAFFCAVSLVLTQGAMGVFAQDDTDITTEPQESEHIHSYTQEVTKPATCAEEGIMTYTCECGDSYSEPIDKSTAHKYGAGEVISEADCTNEGKTVFTCKVCGSEYTKTTPALSHNFEKGEVIKEPTCYEKGEQTLVCTRCGETTTEEIDELSHVFDDGQTTVPATCMDTGTKTYTCTLCGTSFDEDIPVNENAHVWDEGTVIKEANCKNEGSVLYTCTLCGETREEAVPSSTAHKYNEGVITKAPTCGKDGIKTFTCTLCGDTYEEMIPATGMHYFGKATVIKEADCTHTGIKYYVCAGCGLEVATVTPKSAVHKFDKGNVTKEATLTSTGSITYTCTACGKKLTKVIPKLISASELDITLSSTSYTYSGAAKKPSVIVKYSGRTLKSGTDYTVTYYNNINAGKAWVTVKGTGKYTGTARSYYTIKALAISKAAFSGMSKNYVYTGGALTPPPTVIYNSKLLKKNTDYTLTYSANKAIGTATLTVSGKGNFSGTKKLTFYIVPKPTALGKLTSPKTKQLKVTWTKNTTGGGYQVVYSTSSSFKKLSQKTVTGNTKTTVTLTGLTAKKTYYVKIRSFKIVNGYKYYSSYSSVKAVYVK